MIFTCFLTMKSVISHMRFDDLDLEIILGQFLRFIISLNSEILVR